jgi:protein gp37
MSDHSAIEWTDATWNPLRGCSRVSVGCQHCYAERVAARFSSTGMPYEGLIHPITGSWNGKVKLIPEVLGQPWRWVKPRRIFVNSMSDLFHEAVPFEYIAAVFWVMSVTTRHTYQVLTKRPARMLEFFKWVKDYDEGCFEDDRISDVAMDMPAIEALGWNPCRGGRGGYDNCGPAWPYENVWLGVSVENQATADERIPLLLQCPAAVRWLSCEPLLGPLDVYGGDPDPRLAGMIAGPGLSLEPWWRCNDPAGSPPRPHIDWVVAGGESGAGARPMHPDWARSLRDQCAAAGLPFFFKQWGEWRPPVDGESYDTSKGNAQRVPCFIVDRASGCVRCFENDAFEAGEVMRRIGKRSAGRLLDGVEHNAYPVVQS